MTNQLDITQFKKTKVVKKLSKSKSEENHEAIAESEPAIEKKRGRKSKYNTDEERKEARRKQQKEYRERKKQELEDLKKLVEQK